MSDVWERLAQATAENRALLDELEAEELGPPTLSLVPDLEDGCPTYDELSEALHADGPLNDQPAIQRLLRHRAAERAAPQPRLQLIRGADDAA